MRGKPSKMILSILVTMLIICSIGTTVSAAKRFSDVDASHPYYKGTRGHAMMFLWKLAGKPTPNTSGRMPFKDVPSKHPYYKAILWGAQSGITKGYADGTFGINKECTRGQIVTFLWRYKGQPATVQGPYPFKDSPTPAYKKAILWAAKNKITKGYSDKKFHDTYTCTRGQIVTFMYRMTAYLTSEIEPKQIHTHDWEIITEMVHHDAVYEEKEVEHTVCEACGAYYDEMSDEENTAHVYFFFNDAATTEIYTQYSYETVKISDAWDEIISTYYKCSTCGATKAA